MAQSGNLCITVRFIGNVVIGRCSLRLDIAILEFLNGKTRPGKKVEPANCK